MQWSPLCPSLAHSCIGVAALSDELEGPRSLTSTICVVAPSPSTVRRENDTPHGIAFLRPSLTHLHSSDIRCSCVRLFRAFVRPAAESGSAPRYLLLPAGSCYPRFNPQFPWLKGPPTHQNGPCSRSVRNDCSSSSLGTSTLLERTLSPVLVLVWCLLKLHVSFRNINCWSMSLMKGFDHS